MGYDKYINKEVEASEDGENWFKCILTGINVERVVNWGFGGPELGEPITTFTVDYTQTVGHVRPVRRFAKGYKVLAMGGAECTVVGYTSSDRVQINDAGGTEWTCDEDALTLKTESFFRGFDFKIEVAEGVMPGEMIFMDADGLGYMLKNENCTAPVGVAIDLEEETHTLPAYEIGQEVTYPPCDKDSVPIGHVVGYGDDVADVQVQIRGSKIVYEFDENAIVPYIAPPKFKPGDMVRIGLEGAPMLGVVVGYKNDKKVEVRQGIGLNATWLTYFEDHLELYEEPEQIEVQASKDMEPAEKLEKVKEFAKALGVDVNEITGRSGCVGLVVRK